MAAILGPEMLVPESISGIPGCLNVGCFAEVQMPSNPKDAASRSNHSRKATLCIFGATDGCIYVMGGCAGGKVTSAKIVDVCPLESPTLALEKRNAAATMHPTGSSTASGGGDTNNNAGMKASTSQRELNSTIISLVSKTDTTCTTNSESVSSPTTCGMDDLLHDVDDAENTRGAWMMQSVVAFRLSREDVGVIVGYVPSPTSGEQLLNEYHSTTTTSSNKSREKEMAAEYASTLVFYTVKPFDALAVAPEERSLRTTAPSTITNEHLSIRRTVQVKQLVLPHVHLTRLFCIHAESGPFLQVSTDATEPPPHLTLMYSGLDVRNETHDFKCLGWPGKASRRRGRKQEGKMPPLYDPIEGSVLQSLMNSGAVDVPLCSMHYMCFMIDVTKGGRPNKSTEGVGGGTGGGSTRLKELLVAGCVDGRVLLAISGEAHGPRLLVHCSGPVSDVKFFFPSTRRQRHRDKVDFLDDLLDRERRKTLKAASAAYRRRGSTLSSEADSFDFVSEPRDCGSDVSDETDGDSTDTLAATTDIVPFLRGDPKLPAPALGGGLNGSTSQTNIRELSSGSMSSGSPNHSSTNTRLPAVDHRGVVQESSSLTDLIIAVADSAGAVFTFEHFTGELDQMVSTTVLDVEECPGEDPTAMGVGTNSQQFNASNTYESKPSALEPSVVFTPSTEPQISAASNSTTTPGKSVASKWFSSRGKPTVIKEKELGNSVCFGASVESIQDFVDTEDLITPQRRASSTNIDSLRGSGTAGGGGNSRQNSAMVTAQMEASGTPLNQTHPPPTSAQRQKQLNYASSAVWTGTVIARGPTAIAICDVDHDGINELIVTTFGRTIAYCKRRPLVMQEAHRALTGVGDEVMPYGGSTSSFHRDLAIRSNMGSFVAASDKLTVITSLPSIPSDDDLGVNQGGLSPTIRSECAHIAMPSQYAVAFVSEVYCQMYGAAAVDFHACGLRSLVFSGPEQIAVQQLITREDVVEKVIQRLHIVQRLLGITSTELEEDGCESMDDVSSPSCASGTTAVLET